MPIYEQTYRAWEGRAVPRHRWLTIVKQEFAVLLAQRQFIILYLMSFLQVFLRIMQVVAVDTLATSKRPEIMMVVQQIKGMKIEPQMFFDFIRMQSVFVVMMALFAGAGMICNDVRNNLWEVYFAKPLTRRDYILGKFSALCFITLSFTAVPAVFLYVLHFILAPNKAWITELYWIPISSVIFSLLVVVPTMLLVLCCSSLFRSMRFVSLAVLIVLMGNSGMAAILADVLENRMYYSVSIPMAINRLGTSLFRLRPFFTMNPLAATVMVLIVSAICLAILWRRIRVVEIAS